MSPTGIYRMDHPHVTLAVDAGIAASAVFLPQWVYSFSAWAGFITVILGLVVVVLRLLIAMRDLKRGRILQDADVKDIVR